MRTLDRCRPYRRWRDRHLVHVVATVLYSTGHSSITVSFSGVVDRRDHATRAKLLEWVLAQLAVESPDAGKAVVTNFTVAPAQL